MKVGDLVKYKDSKGETEHIGMIYKLEKGLGWRCAEDNRTVFIHWGKDMNDHGYYSNWGIKESSILESAEFNVIKSA